MSTTLHSEILAALADTSSQRPMDTKAIIKKTRRQRGRVEAALSAMYQERSVYCCKIIKGEQESVVWWRSGSVANQTEFYGKRAVTIDIKKAKAAGFVAKPAKATKTVRRISQFSRDVIDTIKATPGMSMPELKAKLAAKGETDTRIHSAASNLAHLGYLRTEGERGKLRYFVGTKA